MDEIPFIAPPHPAVLGPDDLKRTLRIKQQAAIEKWCHDNGVRFFRGPGGIWTTLEALNAALGLRPGSQARPACSATKGLRKNDKRFEKKRRKV